MADVVEELEERKITCSSCKKDVVLKSYIIKDTKPFRFISCADCVHCGFRDVFEEDYQILDHAVRVTCNFDCTNSQNDLKRMAYIHKGANVTFEDSNGELFTFSSDRSHVDCIEGIWLRGKEILESDQISNGRCHKSVIKAVEKSFTDKFRIIINDDSGYSKVCPYRIEYPEIQDMSFEELNEKYPEILYERYERRSSGIRMDE